MKSRMKKLLAAALALCLIAALVPGAALAANSTSVSTGQALVEALETPNANVSIDSDITINNGFTVGSGQTVTVATSHTLTISDGATVTVDAGGKLVVAGTLTVSGTISGSVESSGTVTVNAGAVVGNITSSGSVTVSGTSGTLTLTGGTSNVTGTATSATVSGASTSLTVKDGGQIGNVTVNAGSLSVENDGEAGNVTVNSGSANLADATNVETITVHDEATLKLENTDFIGDSAAISLTDGTITIDGDVIINGTATANNNNFSKFGDITLTGSSELTIKNIDSFDGNIIVPSGAKLVDGNNEILGSASLSVSGGSVTATKNYKWDIDIPRGVTISTGVSVSEELEIDGTYTLAGTFEMPSGSGRDVSLSGTIDFDGGTLNVKSNRNFTVEDDGKLTGNGNIMVAGQLFYEPETADDEDFSTSITVYLQSGGAAYSNTNIDGKLKNAIPGTNLQGYTYARVYSQGTEYDIDYANTTNGSISTANRTTKAIEGQSVSFTTIPSQGYAVQRAYYKEYGSDTEHAITVVNNVGTFAMPDNHVTVYVEFAISETPEAPEGDDYNITVTPNSAAYGSAYANSKTADADETVSIIVTPASGYRVKSVTVNGSTAGVRTNVANALYTFTMPARDVSVIVTFERGEYTVTLSNPNYNDGTISLSSIGTTMTGSFAENEDVTIYVNPDRDFYLRSLSFRVNGISTNIAYEEIREDVYSFIMPEGNVTVTAYFTDGVYEITKDIDGNGSLTITGEDGNVTDVAEEGEEIRITASANPGYRLGDIYVNYTDADDEDQVIYPEVEYKNNGNVDYYWFEMPEYDVEIYADFGEGDHVAWIDRSDMKNGTIRVSPNVADEDDTVSIYVTPDTGYQLDELIVEDEDGHDVTTSSLASGTRYTFRMPDSDVTVTATFKSRSYSSNFTDVPRYEWYYEAVSYVASEGLMNGVSTTQFNPNGTASRAQIVTILWRLAGEPSALTGAFTDVPAGQYYSTAVAWASRQGIVTGVGNNRFEPNSNITREQLAVILYRYAQDAGYTTSASANITGYYDYARVNSYARTAMSWAVGAGLITGTSTTTLSPQDTATRAQVATILMRFCENIAK